MSKRRLSALTLLTFIVSFTSNAAAITQAGGSGLGASASEAFINFINFFYRSGDVASTGVALQVLLAFGLIFYVERFLVVRVLKKMGEAMSGDGHSMLRASPKGDRPKEATAISLIIAAITVNVFGHGIVVIGGFAVGALGLLMFVYTRAQLGASQAIGVHEEAKSYREKVKDIYSREKDAEEEEQQVEEELETDGGAVAAGNEGPAQFETHAEREISQLKELGQKFETIEEEVASVESELSEEEKQTEMDEEEARELLGKAEATQKKLYYGVRMIGDVKGRRPKQLNSDVDMMGDAAKIDSIQGFRDSFDSEDVIDAMNQLEGLRREEFQELHQALLDAKEAFENIQEEKQVASQLSQEMDELVQDLKFYQQLNTEEEQLLHDAEELAEGTKNKEAYRKLKKEEQMVEGDIETFIKNLLNQENKLKSRLQELVKEEKAEEQVIGELIQELNSFQQNLEQTASLVDQLRGRQDLSIDIEHFESKIMEMEKEIRSFLQMTNNYQG